MYKALRTPPTTRQIAATRTFSPAWASCARLLHSVSARTRVLQQGCTNVTQARLDELLPDDGLTLRKH